MVGRALAPHPYDLPTFAHCLQSCKSLRVTLQRERIAAAIKRWDSTHLGLEFYFRRGELKSRSVFFFLF